MQSLRRFTPVLIATLVAGSTLPLASAHAQATSATEHLCVYSDRGYPTTSFYVDPPDGRVLRAAITYLLARGAPMNQMPFCRVPEPGTVRIPEDYAWG